MQTQRRDIQPWRSSRRLRFRGLYVSQYLTIIVVPKRNGNTCACVHTTPLWLVGWRDLFAPQTVGFVVRPLAGFCCQQPQPTARVISLRLVVCVARGGSLRSLSSSTRGLARNCGQTDADYSYPGVAAVYDVYTTRDRVLSRSLAGCSPSSQLILSRPSRV